MLDAFHFSIIIAEIHERAGYGKSVLDLAEELIEQEKRHSVEVRDLRARMAAEAQSKDMQIQQLEAQLSQRQDEVRRLQQKQACDQRDSSENDQAMETEKNLKETIQKLKRKNKNKERELDACSAKLQAFETHQEEQDRTALDVASPNANQKWHLSKFPQMSLLFTENSELFQICATTLLYLGEMVPN